MNRRRPAAHPASPRFPGHVGPADHRPLQKHLPAGGPGPLCVPLPCGGHSPGGKFPAGAQEVAP